MPKRSSKGLPTSFRLTPSMLTILDEAQRLLGLSHTQILETALLQWAGVALPHHSLDPLAHLLPHHTPAPAASPAVIGDSPL